MQFAEMHHGPNRAAAELRARQSTAQPEPLPEPFIARTALPGEDSVWEDHHDDSDKLVAAPAPAARLGCGSGPGSSWVADPFGLRIRPRQLVAASVIAAAEFVAS